MSITSKPSPLAQAIARAKEKPAAPALIEEHKPKKANAKKPEAGKPNPESQPNVSKLEPAAPAQKVRDPNKLSPVAGPYWTGGRNFGYNILRYAETLNLDAAQIRQLCLKAIQIEHKWHVSKMKLKSMHDQAFEKAAVEMGLTPVPYVPKPAAETTTT